MQIFWQISSQGPKLWILLPVSVRRCQRRRFFSLLHNHGWGSPTKFWVVTTKIDNIMNIWYHTLCHQSEEMLYYNHIFVPWQPSRGPAWRRGVIFDSRGVPGQDLNCGKYYSNEFEQSRFAWFLYVCINNKHWFNTLWGSPWISVCVRGGGGISVCLLFLGHRWHLLGFSILIWLCSALWYGQWKECNKNFGTLSLILWLCGARQVKCKRVI